MEAGLRAGCAGPVFELLFRPASGCARGAVLYCHPFAEELNKARRMAAMQARALAADGWAVLLLDHYGCGDSGGDFADARWEIWLADLAESWRALKQRFPGESVGWGLRSGCLLLTEMFHRQGVDAPAVLWHPVLRGDVFLTQFLRMRVAVERLDGGAETTSGLRDRMASGESIEVAGYTLAPALAVALDRARLLRTDGSVLWLEVGDAACGVAPATRRLAEEWQGQGTMVETLVIDGEPFWSTQEIAEVPALVHATRQWLAQR
ncbi:MULTISPECIES: hydrolase 2, exosortase A system-associated [unclassified Halorhodospira]|uniref:hydrolase 2, exosortase A system-associated n=1 Tax=unclassified Halorhodospira TaxID=2626748 RepID=UPI001EE79A91|nr:MULTISPECIES: hydrolase 2, exosortase A system-associated [unclassified Halorhodospira]MCG5540147.1 hydrolase 2, exosortase A system-associated [Halorhodospira sp. M39old]MCG5545152.1 hydrolase 2, exosortase A system-associated [Halorhodospira sp. M38]